MQSSRGGVGSHKHGISGTSDSARNRQQRSRETNRELAEQQRQRAARRGPMVDDIRELFNDKPKRKR